MKQRRKLAVFGLLFVCMVLVLSPITAYAEGENPPGLSDVIKGQQQPAGQPATTQETPTNNTAPTQNTQPEQQPTQSTTEPYKGGLVDIGGLTSKELAGYSGISQDSEAQNTVQSTLGQIMGWVVPILVGVIFAALTIRVLIDILYIVAPFIRPKLAPGVQGDQMAENQMGGGMQYGMGGASGMGMAGGMMGAGGMAGGYGGYGGYGRRGRRGMAGGMAGGAPVGGTQWVSETAIAAVMAGNQVGPNGKPNNPFIFYLKGMVVPLVLIPVMLVLLLSGVLTQVGFYIGDLITSVISSRF